MIRVDAAQLRLADWIRPGDAIVMGQGTAEPLTLTEALVRQRGELGGVRAFLCAMFSDTFKPGATVTFMYCPLRDGRPGGAIGWAKLEDKYLNPADGGCNGGEENQKKWQERLSQGITTWKEEPKAAAAGQ